MADLEADLCVIGGGAAALAAASAGAVLGAKVVIVDRKAEAGAGNSARLALLAAARRAEAVRGAVVFGIGAAQPRIDLAQVQERLRAVSANIALDRSHVRLRALGATVLIGDARFADAATLAVGDQQVRARRFILAPASKPSIPPIPGLAESPYLTGDTIAEIDTRPRHLLVLGAGATALELAQAFRRLGARVTVLQQGRPLPDEDPEVAALVVDALRREEIEFRPVDDFRQVQSTKAGVRVRFAAHGSEQSVEGSHLLVAAGSEADLDGLGLDAAGIVRGPDGVPVNAGLRTSNKRVYAVGAAAGAAGDAAEAWQAGLAVRNALVRILIRAPAAALPRVAFTDPEFAHVGLTEEQARHKYGAIRLLRWPYSENDRARTEHATAGMVKIVTTRFGRILGATIVGPRASETIAIISLAIARHMRVRAIADLPLPYPTLAEAARAAAASDLGRRLTKPWVRRMIGLLRKLG